jgi:hypothetical protein
LHVDNDIGLVHKDIANSDEELSSNDLEQYQLWHERCVHAGPEVIRNLHKHTTLQKVKVPNNREACVTCKLAKLRKTISKKLSL